MQLVLGFYVTRVGKPPISARGQELIATFVLLLSRRSSLATTGDGMFVIESWHQ